MKSVARYAPFKNAVPGAPPQASWSSIILAKGKRVFHGTDCAGNFLLPDGPAWFAFDAAGARRAVHWERSLPRGRRQGPRRVLEAVVKRDIRLIDTRQEGIWREVCAALCKGNRDASTYEVAHAIARRRGTGWYGDTEILLVKPAYSLTAIAVHPLE